MVLGRVVLSLRARASRAASPWPRRSTSRSLTVGVAAAGRGRSSSPSTRATATRACGCSPWSRSGCCSCTRGSSGRSSTWLLRKAGREPLPRLLAPRPLARRCSAGTRASRRCSASASGCWCARPPGAEAGSPAFVGPRLPALVRGVDDRLHLPLGARRARGGLRAGAGPERAQRRGGRPSVGARLVLTLVELAFIAAVVLVDAARAGDLRAPGPAPAAAHRAWPRRRRPRWPLAAVWAMMARLRRALLLPVGRPPRRLLDRPLRPREHGPGGLEHRPGPAPRDHRHRRRPVHAPRARTSTRSWCCSRRSPGPASCPRRCSSPRR